MCLNIVRLAVTLNIIIFCRILCNPLQQCAIKVLTCSFLDIIMLFEKIIHYNIIIQ